MLLSILGVAIIVQLWFVCALLREIRFAIHLVTQQLEYLGAPLELHGSVLCAAKRASE